MSLQAGRTFTTVHQGLGAGRRESTPPLLHERVTPLDVENDILLAPSARASNRADWPYRVFDLSLVVLVLPIALALLALLALVVKLENRAAPVFFFQIRYGQFGRPFRIVKLRTMVPGADGLKVDLVAESVCSGPGFKVANDPRITRPGRWLRKLYLDELPQIINVLRGDMSFVGPRANSYDPAVYEPWQRQRLEVKPGITGSWQVMANKPKDFESRCRIDIEYVYNKSLVGDLRIVRQTLWVCLFRQSGE